ncbi:MAG: putative amidophosphoribosyltransferase [Phormidesmis priestleyi Ana]|uniref:Putative amidophosphoribosyltransferase n=1 Tax=Phormidesmis priestleyi Ana TaxID=1666911 RepID=A0A0P7YU29_9CYAN|nr:MAG: putative amidophosphoribosyltransferase [Phormidesmis priestleyi Ana]
MKLIGRAEIRNALGLFLSRSCPVCDRPTHQTFCVDCQRQIYPPNKLNKPDQQTTYQSQTRRHLSAAVAPHSTTHPTTHQTNNSNDLPVIAFGHYSGSLKRAILAMKYGDRPDVAIPLGTALAQEWLSQQAKQPGKQPVTQPVKQPTSQRLTLQNHSNIYAVPIPLHADRQKSRGFNQAELIARAFCRWSQQPMLAHGLIRVAATQPQHQLGLSARQENLSEVFQVGNSLSRLAKPTNKKVKDISVLLIDDIYTTGATARSAAEALTQSGISVVGIAVVAQAML